jgi:hypothetical protein
MLILSGNHGLNQFWWVRQLGSRVSRFAISRRSEAKLILFRHGHVSLQENSTIYGTSCFEILSEGKVTALACMISYPPAWSVLHKQALSWLILHEFKLLLGSWGYAATTQLVDFANIPNRYFVSYKFILLYLHGNISNGAKALSGHLLPVYIVELRTTVYLSYSQTVILRFIR